MWGQEWGEAQSRGNGEHAPVLAESGEGADTGKGGTGILSS